MTKKNQIALLGLLLLTLLCFIQTSRANPPTTIAIPKNPSIVPAAPHLSAKSYILVDAKSGQVIAEKNADLQLPPASLTKIMTMYVISNALQNQQISLEDRVKISNKAWRTGGSKMFVREGQTVKVKDLIKGIVIQSGNDASVAMAERIAGKEVLFVDQMNEFAEQLGMKNSHFVDSTGLPKPNHVVTARDMAILASALIENYPEYYKWYKERKFKFNDIEQYNRNRLLWHDSTVDGIKTGHTKQAGYCLVSSAKRGDMRLIAVIMGTKSDNARTEDSQRLLNYGFRFYASYKLYNAAQELTKARVWQGKHKKVALGIAEDLYITIPRDQYKNLKASMTLNGTIKAPVKKGQTLGTVNIILNEKTIASRPLIALQSDKRGGWWTRFSDRVSLTLTHWFGDDETERSQQV